MAQEEYEEARREQEEEAASDAVAERYAQALFDLGLEHDKLDTFLDQIQAVRGVFDTSRPFRHLLLHPGIERAERRSAIRELADDWGLDEMVRNFLFILLDNERVRKLDEIERAYRQTVDEHHGNVRATVTSAVELDDGQRDAIREVLSDATGKDVILETEVDESLIGGAVTRLGDMEFDGSVSNHFDQLKQRILREV